MTLDPFHVHYTLKDQREQAEKQEHEQGKSKGKGKNARQKQIFERTQEYQELHNLIETKRVNTTPATHTHTTKYERSSCRIGDISGFMESERVLESRTTTEDKETAQRMKE